MSEEKTDSVLTEELFRVLGYDDWLSLQQVKPDISRLLVIEVRRRFSTQELAHLENDLWVDLGLTVHFEPDGARGCLQFDAPCPELAKWKIKHWRSHNAN